MKTFEIAGHINQDDLDRIILYVTRHFNYLNTMYRVEKRGDYFYLYWNMTEQQYVKLVQAYWKDNT